MKKIIVILFFASFVLQSFSQSREVPFTLDDRDRIMRTEEKLDALKEEVNVKIESLRNEMNAKFDAIDSKVETLYWGFGILIAIMLFMLGFIIWDRRTALDPVRHKTVTHEERLNKLEFITREQAKKDPAFAELLKLAGLL